MIKEHDSFHKMGEVFLTEKTEGDKADVSK